MTTGELSRYIFDAPTDALFGPFDRWVHESRRFRAFAEAHRDKIRKKVRCLQDDESEEDLRFELEIAYRLLAEPRFRLEYEKYASGKRRGPDFSVLFRERHALNVEAKRIRDVRPESFADKFADTVCDKVGQMPIGLVNVLLLGLNGLELAGAAAALQERLRRKEDAYFVKRGFGSANAFSRQFRRLSAVLLYGAWDNLPEERCRFWANPAAARPLPPDVRRLLLERLAPADSAAAASP
jgi:hypothetical protein